MQVELLFKPKQKIVVKPLCMRLTAIYTKDYLLSQNQTVSVPEPRKVLSMLRPLSQLPLFPHLYDVFSQ